MKFISVENTKLMKVWHTSKLHAKLQSFSFMKTNRFMLYKEIITALFENGSKYILFLQPVDTVQA
jgi:hypothetical protein